MNNIARYYEILGLKPGASEAEIKESFRKLAKTWHPDRFPNEPQLKQKAEEEIKKINEAYQQLKSYQASSGNETNAVRICYTYSSNGETFYREGVKKANQERYQEAIEDFTQAIRINPNYIEAYKYRGLVCEKLGYNHRAKSDLQKALELEFKQSKPEPKASTPPTDRVSQRSQHSTPPPDKVPSQRSQHSTPATDRVSEREQPPKPPTPASSAPTSPWICIRTLTEHSDALTATAISGDGRILATGSADKTIKLWQLSTGKVIHTLTGHSDRVRCVAISSDGMILGTGSADRKDAPASPCLFKHGDKGAGDFNRRE